MKRRDPEAIAQVQRVLSVYVAKGAAEGAIFSNSAMMKAMRNVPGQGHFGEVKVIYTYLDGTAQPTACKAFWIGEALGPRTDLNSEALNRPELCGLLFIAVAGQLEEFVKIVAEILRRHPDLREELIGFVGILDDITDYPSSYARSAIPLFSPKTHCMVTETCHDLFRPSEKKTKGCAELVLDLNNEQLARFGGALHAAKNESVPLRERTEWTRIALLRSLAWGEVSSAPNEQEDLPEYLDGSLYFAD